MKEDNLASEFARGFSELFPEKRGQLFHVSNERNNEMQAIKAKAKGIVPGVADFIYFDGLAFGFSNLVAIELKLIGSYHLKDKVQRQLNWAKVFESNGGVWRLCRTKEEAISCTQFNFKGLTVQEVETMLKSDKNKSIKF